MIPELLNKENPQIPKNLGILVREAGLEPARPEWTLEPESSESANSTTRAFAVSQLLEHITTDIPACQAEEREKLKKTAGLCPAAQAAGSAMSHFFHLERGRVSTF